MASKGFTFKQFEINHENCAMKVGTDGVLLGAWCACDSAQRIADIGTGTGLIALMCAQRNASATIDAIEIDHSAAECARENIAHSAWSDRIRVIETAIQNFDAEERYDLIVSNPPYFSETLQSPDPSRATARHNCSLPHRDLIAAAQRLLTDEGRMALILPTDEARRFAMQAVVAGLHLRRRCEVITKRGAMPKRTMSEWSLAPCAAEHEQLILADDDGSRSEEYSRLTEEFYLH